MRKLLRLPLAALALALTFGLGGAANASYVVSGVFSIDVYNYNAGGVSANADATPGNVTANAGNLVNSITYTGSLDFFTPPGTTILAFLQSGGGLLSDTTGLNIAHSTGNFQTTTLLDITWNASLPGGTIEHDDGISLYDDGILVTPASAALPTVAVDTTYGPVSGNLRLIYSAANSNPEVLQVTAVPIPGAVWLFGSGVLGLLGVGYSRKRKAAA